MARLLDESCEAKKHTSQKVSNKLIERQWTVGHQNGAKAGKVSGAGGGGYMMFLVDPDARPQLLRALQSAGGRPDIVSFSSGGVAAWPAVG
jgi:D-glycero-alpha-D-manno-heptose-7-phosphate kinase